MAVLDAVPCPLPEAVLSLVMTRLAADEPVPVDAVPVRITVSSLIAVCVPTPVPVAVRGAMCSPVAACVPVPDPVAVRGAT